MGLTFWNQRRKAAEDALDVEETPEGADEATPDAGQDAAGAAENAPEGGSTPEGENGGESGAQPAPEPKGNASTEEWTAYALANGKTEEDLAGLNRDAIRDLFA